VKDSVSGSIILKLVNGATSPQPVRIELVGAKRVPATAEATVLAGPDANVVNDHTSPRTVMPRASRLPISAAFDYEAPANSLTVIRITP
jgi:alpha-L-arabinofuranosidase